VRERRFENTRFLVSDGAELSVGGEFELINLALDFPIVSLLYPSSEPSSSSSSALTVGLEKVEFCGRALSLSDRSIIGPPSATVYRFLGVGLTLAGRSAGLFGSGKSLDCDADDMVPVRPEDTLPYDEAEEDGLVVVLGSPGIFSGRVEEREEGGECVGEANAPRSGRVESGGVA